MRISTRSAYRSVRLGLALAALCLGADAQLPVGVAVDLDNGSWKRQFDVGDADLSFTPVGGNVVLRVPLALPRGAGGFTPELELGYDSGDLSNGPLGVGWRLGWPRIESRRLPHLGVVTDYVRGVERSRLVELGAHDGGRLYGLRSRAHGPFLFHFERDDHWVLVDEDGTEWTFGAHPSLARATRGSLRTWYLEQAVDPFGHRILASYRLSGDELVPQALGYVDLEPLAAPAARSADGTIDGLCAGFHYCVELVWGDRPDPVVAAHDGAVFRLRHRLERIDLGSRGEAETSWLLHYAPAADGVPGRTERSMLTAIRRRGSAADGAVEETLLQVQLAPPPPHAG